MGGEDAGLGLEVAEVVEPPPFAEASRSGSHRMMSHTFMAKLDQPIGKAPLAKVTPKCPSHIHSLSLLLLFPDGRLIDVGRFFVPGIGRASSVESSSPLTTAFALLRFAERRKKEE